MKQLVLIILVLWSVSCAQVSPPSDQAAFDFPEWLRAGYPIPGHLKRERSSEGLLTIAIIESNYFYALYPIDSHGMRAKVLTHQPDKAKIIQGILVDDPNCVTIEGIAPGSRYGDIKLLAPGVPRAHYGWGHFWDLPSGWIAVFGEGSTKEEHLTDDSRVVQLVAYGRVRKLGDLKLNKAAQLGATDNPDDAQRLREDH